jgi:hypothetical protein
MEIKLTLNGRTRKDAANCIGESIGEQPVYQRAPTYAYQIGNVTLDRQGVVAIGDSDEALAKVLAALEAAGFYTPESPVFAATPINPNRFVVTIPAAKFTTLALENLHKLVASKSTLLKKAIGTDNLTILRNETLLTFPWFNVNPTPEEAETYTKLVTALGEMAKKQQRVLATDHPVDNEKYAFRCFLLRLGFIGEEFAAARAILLCNLSGDGSHKSGSAPRKSAKSTIKVEVVARDETEVAPEPAPQPIAKPRFSLKKLFTSLKIMALD